MQPVFPSYLIFSIALGITLGAVMGGYFGSIETITLSKKGRTWVGIVTGAFVGIFGGIIGFLAGQGALLLLGEFALSNRLLQTYGIPLARTVGWACLGMIIGSVEGIRSLSFAKIRIGILGGLFGGILGGLALEYSRLILPNIMFARLSGLLVLGLLIGLFYSLFEKQFSHGVLKLLNGKLKGKEYLVVQKTTSIGKSTQADIQLSDYTDIADLHAKVVINGDKVLIVNQDDVTPVIVNEYRIKEHLLKIEDVIQIGNAKFLYFFK